MNGADMRVRLRPGVRIMWRDATTLQIGFHTVPIVQVAAPTTEQLKTLTALKNHGIRHDRSNPLLAQLSDAKLLLPMAGDDVANFDHASRKRRAADARILGMQSEGGSGWAHHIARSQAGVEVQGLGRTGAGIARRLVHAGVGRLIIKDGATVTWHDVAPGAYSSRRIGDKREIGLRAELERDAPETVVSSVTDEPPDVTVLVSYHAISPQQYRGLMRHDIPHLAVVISDVRASVGPLVLPGRTPCLRCLDLHRTDADSAWPTLATQLMTAQMDDPEPEESLLADTAATLAAGQVLNSIGRQRPAAVGATIEFEVFDYLPALRKWTMHPDCGCAAP